MPTRQRLRIGHVEPSRVDRSLLERLANPDGEVRRIALLDLQYSDEGDFVAIAVGALADPDARVRAEASDGFLVSVVGAANFRPKRPRIVRATAIGRLL